jgi:hypothetical protein
VARSTGITSVFMSEATRYVDGRVSDPGSEGGWIDDQIQPVRVITTGDAIDEHIAAVFDRVRYEHAYDVEPNGVLRIISWRWDTRPEPRVSVSMTYAPDGWRAVTGPLWRDPYTRASKQEIADQQTPRDDNAQA